MEFDRLTTLSTAFLADSPDNYVKAEDALTADLAGMQIYDEPLFAVASADDPLFKELQKPGIVGPGAYLPSDWLSDAKSVISFFLPFTQQVKISNRILNNVASNEWLHARIEGQLVLDRLGKYICSLLADEGFEAVYPTTDKRFRMLGPYASCWSERHVAYVCGLGTFGLSKGLITKKGMAGRFGSVVTNAVLPVTVREYSDPFEYCTMCGKCQINCPVNAIDKTKGVANGKDQLICGPFVNSTFRPPHGPNQRKRYGCGKCQVAVPCESGIPGRK